MKNIKEQIIKEIGLEQLIGFDIPNTKAGQEVLEKAGRAEKYRIYTNDKNVTIYTNHLVTKKEQKVFEKITGKKFKKIGSIVEDNGRWFDWIGYKK